MDESNFLIAPDNHWAIWGVIIATTSICLWIEQTPVGKRLNAYIMCIAAAAILANAGIIPPKAPAYDVVWSYGVPLAIAMLLFHADMRRVARESGLMLIAFIIAGIGTIAGTVVAFYTVPIGADAQRMTASFCATYIGGSLNYVSAADVIGLESGDLMAAGVAADNVLTSVFILVLFGLAGSPFLAKWYVRREALNNDEADDSSGTKAFWEQRTVSLRDLGVTVALGWIICWIGVSVAPFFDELTRLANTTILIITVLAVAVASIFPRQLEKLNGGEVVGAYLMHIFFVVLGASAHIPTVLEYGVLLFVFAGVLLTVHLIVVLTLGWIARLDLRELILASNASVGGPPTAVAMAAAKGWDRLITPSVLCGTLGYAVGTFIGIQLARWLGVA